MARRKKSIPNLREVQKGLARQNLQAFVLYTMPNYLMGWVHERICWEMERFLEDVVAQRSPRLIITMPPRSGKLCADSTPVLTPTGWATHGELKPGDFVFSPSGKPVQVLAVGPKGYATHGVTFTTGETIATHLDHEWQIYSRPMQSYRTVETRFFVEPSKKTGQVRRLSSGEIGKRGGRYLYQVDNPSPLQMPAQEHVLHPYALGVWLGDGSSSKPHITMCQTDATIVKNEFRRLGINISASWIHKTTGVETFSCTTGIPNIRGPMSQALKELNLLNNKHIPDSYKFDSLENRLELLAGLVDTDGHLDSTGRYHISTIFPRLADDIEELLLLCSIRCGRYVWSDKRVWRNIYSPKPVYVIGFSAANLPCRLDRKQSLLEHTNRREAICAVNELDEHLVGNCIQVDSPDGLYLVGRTLIPTHNSELVSRRFPAYAFGKHPDLSIIAASYSSDLASRMNRDVQRIIDDDLYKELFPDTALYGKNIRTTAKGSYLRNSDIFEIVGHEGVYRSAGVGGGITGMGCSIAIIDDPIKDRMSADSPTIRQNIWDWYTSTLYTRLAPGGGVIVMLTKWHTDDLAGRLLETERAGEGDHWKVINFPAIAEQDEYYQGKLVRKAGDALHPERYPLEQLLAIKQAIGSRDWAALYQQHPIPDGGAIFKAEWLRFWLPKDLPNFDLLLSSWDMTFKEGKDNDFVVGQVWGRTGANFYLLDQVRGRWGFTETLHNFQRLAQKWPMVRRHLIEDKANGPAVIDTLRNTVAGIIPVEPCGSKVARAHAVTTYFEAGNVFIPHPSIAPWVNDFIAELTTFPSAAHDDQVDAATQAVFDMQTRRPMYIDPSVLRTSVFQTGSKW